MKQLLLITILMFAKYAFSQTDTTKLKTSFTHITSYGKIYYIFYDKRKAKYFYMRTSTKRFYFKKSKTL